MQAGVTLNIKKCYFCHKKVKYLGHIISADGIATDPQKTSAIDRMLPPKNRTQVRSFVQMVNYYRKFIKDFAKVANPLNLLLKGIDSSKAFNNQPFERDEWSTDCQNAFTELKRRLTTAPILAYPDFQKPFILSLESDASATQIGAVLAQPRPGSPGVLCYISRKLTERERRYEPIQRELLCIRWASKLLRPYLHARQFHIVTDHFPLKSILTTKDLSSKSTKVQALATDVMDLDFSIDYKPGKLHFVPDALSRLPTDEDVAQDTNDILLAIFSTPSAHLLKGYEAGIEDEIVMFEVEPENQEAYKAENYLRLNNSSVPHTVEEWLKAQKADATYKKLFDETFRLKFLERKKYNRQNKYFINERGLLVYRSPSTGRDQICVPKSFIRMVLEQYHRVTPFSHYGPTRTRHRIEQRFFWPTMIRDIVEFVQHCDACQRQNTRKGNTSLREH